MLVLLQTVVSYLGSSLAEVEHSATGAFLQGPYGEGP